jgi:hypothetical protein
MVNILSNEPEFLIVIRKSMYFVSNYYCGYFEQKFMFYIILHSHSQILMVEVGIFRIKG